MAVTTEKWTALTDRGEVLTTQLNALASGSFCAAGAEINNKTNLDRYGILELTVTFGSAPTDEAGCDVFCVPALDDTNYADGSATVNPAGERYVTSFTAQNSTSAQRLVSGEFTLPPAKVKFILYNWTGVSFPASGSIVKLYTFNRKLET